MATDPKAGLADLRHEVIAKCGNLKTAVGQLTGEATASQIELAELMKEQARYLSERISAYAAALNASKRR